MRDKLGYDDFLYPRFSPGDVGIGVKIGKPRADKRLMNSLSSEMRPYCSTLQLAGDRIHGIKVVFQSAAEGDLSELAALAC